MDSPQRRELGVHRRSSHLDELLLEILGDQLGASTYASICHVNRHLRRIATPLLYHTNFLEPHGHGARYSRALFYRTLVQQPELARHVKRLEWHYSPYDTEELKLFPEIAASSLRAREEQFVAEAAENNENYRYSEARSDALLTSVLMSITNIEHLRLMSTRRVNITARRRWFDPIRICNLHTFEHLKTTHVAIATIKIRDVAWLMNLPSLKQLSIKRLDAWEEATWTPARASSNVHDITLAT
jgi:hypothetical protein